jgi:hypothetical protein
LVLRIMKVGESGHIVDSRVVIVSALVSARGYGRRGGASSQDAGAAAR